MFIDAGQLDIVFAPLGAKCGPKHRTPNGVPAP
jgi:hypothetical protein